MEWPVYRPGRKPELGFPQQKKKEGWFVFSDGLIGRSHAGAAERQTGGRGRGGVVGGGGVSTLHLMTGLCASAQTINFVL